MATVYIVEADPKVQRSLADLISRAGHDKVVLASARSLLARPGPLRGCLLLDLRLPDMGGLELLAALREREEQLPAILLGGPAESGAAEDAVRAFKSGAVDFLHRPIDNERLLAGVGAALAADERRRRADEERAGIAARLGLLTPRELYVVQMAGAGYTNKAVAELLGVTSQAVDARRANAMRKLGVQTLAGLVRFVVQAEVLRLMNGTSGTDTARMAGGGRSRAKRRGSRHERQRQDRGRPDSRW